MIKNYFFLSRIASELSCKIKGSLIRESYTSKKDTLYITFSNEKEDTLEICVNHSLPFIKLESLYRRKRNSVDIFSQILNLKFSDLFIAKNDRVLLFQIENEISLFFAIRGKFTNLYLFDGIEFVSFKKTPSEDLQNIRKEILALEFVIPLNLPDFSDADKQLNTYELKKKYPFLSSGIINNIKDNAEIPVDSVLKEINNIYNNDFYLINDFEKKTTEISYSPPDNKYQNQVEKYSSALEVSAKYLSMLKYFNDFNKFYNSTQKQIDKELVHLNNKKKNILARMELGSKEETFRKFAELLLINKSKLSTGLNEIVINDVFENNNPITIQLNRKYSPRQNCEYYFNKAKEEKIFFERSKKILFDIDKRLEILTTASVELNQCESLNDILSIMKNIGLKMKKVNSNLDEPKIKFRQYIIENKYKVFVGKDSQSNDLLTLKFAKQNDFWFHARSVSGSHVILRLENKSEIVPKSILNKVASIAAFYSKAKSSSLVSVSYTQKKYVIKKKGMDIGQVLLLKENTLLVKPEIPEDTLIVEQK